MKWTLFCFLFMSSLAHAREIKVLQLKPSQSDTQLNLRFGINPKIRSAWIEVEAKGRKRKTYYLHLSGLSIDKEGKNVVFHDGNDFINCADIVTTGRSIFKRDVVQNSGKCEFITKFVRVMDLKDNSEEDRFHLQAFMVLR